MKLPHYHVKVQTELEGETLTERYHCDGFSRVRSILGYFSDPVEIRIRTVRVCRDPESLTHRRVTS